MVLWCVCEEERGSADGWKRGTVPHLVCMCRYDETAREVLCRHAQERAFTMPFSLELEHRVDAVVAGGVAQEESAGDDPVVARG